MNRFSQTSLPISSPFASMAIDIERQIHVLTQHIQFPLELAFGKNYNPTLSLCLKLAQGRQKVCGDVTAMLDIVAFLQTSEVRLIIEQLADRFGPDTQLEEIIQSLCAEYSKLLLKRRKASKPERDTRIVPRDNEPVTILVE